MRRIEHQGFLLLLVAVTLAFAWVLQPFYGAVLWAIVVAVIFSPVYRRLLASMNDRRSLAAAVTVLIIIAIVILPLAMIATSLAQEASSLFAKIQSGEYNLGNYLQRILDALPAWATGLIERFNLTDFSALRERLAAGLMKGGQVLAPQALSIGMNTFDFMIGLGIMLYLLFFLLRDGRALAERIKEAIPLHSDQKAALFTRFADVVRATVKGGIVVAIAQGALGGIAFWLLGIHAALLWAVVMAFLSLIPAVGATLVWLPVAIYFLATGAIWQGIGLILYGVLGQSAPPIPGRQGHQTAGLRGADLHARRHRSFRPERFRHRPADRGNVHGELGNIFGIAGSGAGRRLERRGVALWHALWVPAHRERPGDWSGRFPLITEAALRNRNSSFVIDGEAVLLGVYGRSDFNGLHTRKHDHEVEFYAFDMLVSAGDDLRRLPLGMRKDAAQQRVAYGSTSSECCYCRSAEPLPLQTVGSNGQEGTDHEIVWALLVAVNAWGIMPASSEDCEPGLSLASLDNPYMVGSIPHRAEPDRNTALVKEGEFDSPETIAAIEKNREDRERIVVMDQ